ncbi:uncharacterized oxidoreductase SERP2049-like [Bradysia coprophila]|uniref:uncharacterized oxidoreductase SERP2049-like n=1 Tax=Bradysia coprophila TaxID=38358 RepID=UPI00187DB0BF|nr:uncharacterized oxidoreductase SERP2049-like [Bradysia coprophila]
MRTATVLICALIYIQCISIINGDTDDIKVSPEELDEVANALNFRGKVVLITGSSGGIGATTARLLAKLGAQLVVTGRNLTRINEVVNDCYQLSPYRFRPLALRLDLSNRGNCAKLVNATIAAYGKIDVLVNNAGIGLVAPIQDPNFNEFYSQVRKINEEASVEVTRLAAPYIQSSSGSVIFIASILGWNPVSSTGGYSMSKNAITAIAKTLSHDLGPNVRVNIVSPGIVDGTRIFRLMDPGVRPLLIQNSIASSSMRRAGVPLDIAKLIVFLASNLSGCLDGQNLHADQGAYVPLL